jgi:hypothetical protein
MLRPQELPQLIGGAHAGQSRPDHRDLRHMQALL